MRNKILLNIFLLIFSMTLPGLTACSDDDSLFNDLPPKIVNFVSEYFPDYGVENYVHSKDNLYHVRLKKGPGMTFNANQEWITINGYGLPLPRVLLFDQLPPALYLYLQETENTESVFSVERDGFTYTLVLLNDTVRYDIATGEVTVKTPSVR